MKKLIVGNWKMHLNVSQSSLLLHRLQERVETHTDVEVVLAPSFLALQPLSVQLDRRKFKLAAQNCFWQDEGAYTGEVSAYMLRDLVHYIIVGHSERRNIFNEDDDLIAKKMSAVVRNQITPILCVGENIVEYQNRETKQVLHDQLMVDLMNLTTEDVKNLVIAYEPVWAISDGEDYEKHKTPTKEEVASAVETIRKNIFELYGKKAAKGVRVLYGGSTNPGNARTYLTTEGVDGLLVGGASLNYDYFSKMTEIAHQVAKEES